MKQDKNFKTCPVCGRIFYVWNPGEYVYKLNVKGKQKILCSWTCLRRLEKSLPQKKVFP